MASSPPSPRPLMVLGTSSGAGKSLMTAALCRVLRRRGETPLPFKGQNMSNNAWVDQGGGEVNPGSQESGGPFHRLLERLGCRLVLPGLKFANTNVEGITGGNGKGLSEGREGGDHCKQNQSKVEGDRVHLRASG